MIILIAFVLFALFCRPTTGDISRVNIFFGGGGGGKKKWGGGSCMKLCVHLQSTQEFVIFMLNLSSVILISTHVICNYFEGQTGERKYLLGKKCVGLRMKQVVVSSSSSSSSIGCGAGDHKVSPCTTIISKCGNLLFLHCSFIIPKQSLYIIKV